MEELTEEVIVPQIPKDGAWDVKEQEYSFSVKESTLCLRWGHSALDVLRD